jgi:mannose-6-phosphate isomerase-like protein (cupin superfamily)
MKITLKDHVTFRPDRMAKVALARTDRAQLDLYCLEPGQEQKPHAHDGQDKIYVVLEGAARIVVDGEESVLAPGDAVLARAGQSHGVRNPGPAPLVALVVMSPPPEHG